VNEHPEFELLDAHALGALDPSEAARVEAHLRDCPACRREYAELRHVLDVLPHALPALPAPTALRDRIMAAIEEPQHPIPPASELARPTPTPVIPPRFARRDFPLIGSLAAALALALIGDAYFAFAGRSVDRAGVPVVALQPTPSPTPRPSPLGSPPVTIRPTVPPAVREARAEAATIAVLERRLASAQHSAGTDAARIRRLEGELADARNKPRIVRIVVAPPRPARTAVPLAATTARPVSVAVQTASPAASAGSIGAADSTALIAALRSGKVYAVDGVVGIQPWHLTIVQPRNGNHALVFSGTPGAPAGDTYRTWVIRAGQTVDIGELPPNKPTTLQMPMALEPGDVIAFSREPVGAGNLPTQPFLMQFTVPQ
jgi:hypothetical protein